MPIAETSIREPPSKRKEELDGQDRKPKPREMGLQVPRGVYPERAQKRVVRTTEERAGSGISKPRATQGKSNRGRTPDARPGTHDASIPPKYAVSNVVGYIKGKSAIHLARTYGERKRNFAGQSFWARRYFVSTVGRDEEVIRNCIRNQEKEDVRLEQLGLWR